MQLGEIKEENINFVTLKDILGHIWQRQTSDRHNRQEMQDIAENWAENLASCARRTQGRRNDNGRWVM